jgi:ribosomal protein S18 acetylase RimI-like enzyme
MEPVIVRAAGAADVPGIARVHVDSWRTTYRGILPDAFLDGLTYGARERQWGRTIERAAETGTVVGVAVAEAAPPGGQIVGIASGGPPRPEHPVAAAYAGELYTLYLLRAYQRRGIGARLLRHVAGALAAAGRRSLVLWVARENPARGFYEAAGGRPVAERRIVFEGQPIDEVAYGWPDTGALLTADDAQKRQE